MSATQSTQEWFASQFPVDDMPDVETIGAAFASLAATSLELVEVSPEEVERVMQDMNLRPKVKGKIRRALEDLRTTPRVPTTDVPTAPRFDESSFAARPDSPPPERPPVPKFRRDLPRIPGAFIVPTLASRERSVPWKTIMVVGETGCGKTTTLNSMVNYLWGVQLQDHFRFVLVPPPQSESAQAYSVTSDVTAYNIRPPNLKYGLTIIDTPGFGDTKGLEADMNIVESIEDTFRRDYESIHAIFFIVRNSGRLDARMKYVFNSVLRLFGRNVVSNLFALVTFADGTEPPVLATMREAEMPVKEIFELNNSAFFNGFQPENAIHLSPDMCYQPGEIPQTLPPPPQDLMARSQTQPFWEMGNQAMDKLFRALTKKRSCSLKLSVSTLELRKKIRQHVALLHEHMSNVRENVASLRAEVATAQREAANMAQNENYVVEGSNDEKYKDYNSRNHIICPNCSHTCHIDCGPIGNQHIEASRAIRNGCCTICPGKCHWTTHNIQRFQWKTRKVRHTTIREGMKESFEASKSKLEETVTTVSPLCPQVAYEHQVVKSIVKDIRDWMKNLTKIALLSAMMEDGEYYDKLIATEESRQDDGWEDRSRMLKDTKEQAGLLKTTMDAKSVNAALISIFQPAVESLQSEVQSLTQQAGGNSPSLAEVSQIVAAVDQMLQDIQLQAPRKKTTRTSTGIMRIVQNPCPWLILSLVSIGLMVASFRSIELIAFIFPYPWVRIVVKSVGAVLAVIAMSMASLFLVEMCAQNPSPNGCARFCGNMCGISSLPLYLSSFGRWSKYRHVYGVLFYGGLVAGGLLIMNESYSLPLFAVGVAISLFTILFYSLTTCVVHVGPPPTSEPDRSRYVRASCRLILFVLLFSVGASLVASSTCYNDGFVIVEEATGMRRKTRIFGGTIGAIGFAGFLAESIPRWWTLPKGRRLATAPGPEALRSSYRFFMAMALSSVFYGLNETSLITPRLIIEISTLATAGVAVLAALLRLCKRNDAVLWNMLRVAIFLAAYPASLLTNDRLFRNLCRATCCVILIAYLTSASLSTIDGVRKGGNGNVQRCLQTYKEVQFAGGARTSPYLAVDGRWADVRIGYFLVLYGSLAYTVVVVADWIESPSRDSTVIHALRFVATLTSSFITFAYGFITIAVNLEPPSTIVQPKLRTKYWKRMAHFLFLNLIIALGGSLMIMAHDPRHNNIGEVDVVDDIGVNVNVDVRMQDIGIVLVTAAACAWMAEALPRIAQPDLRRQCLTCDPPKVVRALTYFWCLCLESGIVLMLFAPSPSNMSLFVPSTENLPFIGMVLGGGSLLILLLLHLIHVRCRSRNAGPRSGAGDADDFADENV